MKKWVNLQEMKMKRQLNEDEKKLIDTNSKRIDEELKGFEDNRDYNIALIEKQETLRKFDDRWRKYLRDVKDKEDDLLMKQLGMMIKEKQETLKVLEKQLKEGVDKPSSVD